MFHKFVLIRPLQLAGLLFFSTSVLADWVEYTIRSNGDVYFYDNARVEKTGNEFSVWIRVRYKTSVMAASSYQSHLKLNCSESSETVLQSTFFTDKNWAKPAMATNMNAKSKTSITENSTSQKLIRILCVD